MFTGPLRLEVAGPDLWMVVDEPLVWVDGDTRVSVPVGFVTDLASIPRALRGLLDINGRSRRPAMAHDWMYTSQPFPREQCDEIFRKALIAEGESEEAAWIYWEGVRIGGASHWDRKSTAQADCKT